MDEVVAADGESVSVARHLPDGQLRVGHLAACGNGGRTTVNGVHAVGIHVVGQAAGTADTRNHCDAVGSHAYLGHGFVQGGQEKVVAATRTPAGLSFLIIFCCIFAHNVLL